jgi:hypothetical protein
MFESGERLELLFSDIVMPNGMSGVELAREAKRRNQDIKVLLTSSYTGGILEQHRAVDEFPIIAPGSLQFSSRLARWRWPLYSLTGRGKLTWPLPGPVTRRGFTRDPPTLVCAPISSAPPRAGYITRSQQGVALTGNLRRASATEIQPKYLMAVTAIAIELPTVSHLFCNRFRELQITC